MGRHAKIQNKIAPQKAVTKIKTPSIQRGMKDILPNEQIYWDFIKKEIKEISQKYGFKMIDTPTIEEKSLFQKALGKQSNIVTKKLFAFSDPSGNNVCLKPDNTPVIARAYIKHSMHTLTQPIKLCYIDRLFRYEKPQSGKYRQFNQAGFEIIGDGQAITDAQLILACKNFFNGVGIKNTLQINSIGCIECRENYIQELSKFFKTKKTRICPDCKKKIYKNPLNIMNCEEKSCQAEKEGCPQIIDWLCEDCKKHFVKLLEYLDELDIAYYLNPYLVRELDYYTRTVFEIWPDDEKNEKDLSQNSLCGGGRYDNLIENIGGKPTPGAGFSIGIERVILKLKKDGRQMPQHKNPTIFLAQLGEQAKMKCLKLFEELHKNNINAIESLSQNGL
ncbi:histidine--tRNA ligase, partial [Patescibacteria group bacterium]